MSGNIYVMQPDGHLVAMQEQAYDSEAVLQTLLAQYPTLLAGEQIDRVNPRRWIVVAREVGLPSEAAGADRWSVDHLLLDHEGIPTLVEVKRSSDTRIRREVVGQMLDYAAHAVLYWSLDTLRTTFEHTCTTQGSDPVQVLDALLGSDADQEQFWQQVMTNLQLGKMRLIFVADSIPPELQRIVEFLNSQMQHADVLAVEIRQYVGQGLKTLVPRVVAAQPPKVPPRPLARQWDAAAFFQALETRCGSVEASIARKILAWAQSRKLRIWWGKGTQDGSFFPMYDYQGKQYWLISVWTYGRLEIQFQMMQTTPPFDAEAKRVKLLQRLNALPGVTIVPTAITRRPPLALSLLQDDTVLQQFLAIGDWIIQEITTS